MREMDSNLPPDAPSWPSVEFSSGDLLGSGGRAYRDMTEARIRNDDARPLLAGIRHPCATVPRRRLPRSNLTGALPQRTLEYVAKVVERLHREVRYTGVEFGDARLIPEYPPKRCAAGSATARTSPRCWSRRCAPRASTPILRCCPRATTRTSRRDLPGLGMFDHAIVYVPGAAAKDLWIDATAEYARVGTLPAQATDRLALIIRAGQKELTRTPAHALRRQPPGRDARFLPRRIRPGARGRNHRDAWHHRRPNTAAWYAGADNKARLDDLKTYMREHLPRQGSW